MVASNGHEMRFEFSQLLFITRVNYLDLFSTYSRQFILNYLKEYLNFNNYHLQIDVYHIASNFLISYYFKNNELLLLSSRFSSIHVTFVPCYMTTSKITLLTGEFLFLHCSFVILCCYDLKVLLCCKKENESESLHCYFTNMAR